MTKPSDALLSFPHNYGPVTNQIKADIPVLSVTQLGQHERRYPAAETAKHRPQSPSFLLSSKKVVFSEREKLSPESKPVSPSTQDAKFGSHTGNVVVRDALASGSMQDWWQSLITRSGRTAIDNTMPRPNFDAWFRQCVLCTDMEKPLAWAKATCTKVVGGLNSAVFHTTCTIDNFAECLLLLADSQLVADAFKGTDIVMSHFVASLRRMTEVDLTFQKKSIISMPWWNKVKSAPYLPPSSSPWNNVQPSRSSYFDSSNSTSFSLSTEWSVKTSNSPRSNLHNKGDNSFIPPSKMLFKSIDSEHSPDTSVISDFTDLDYPAKSSNLSSKLDAASNSFSRPGSAPASRSLHVGMPNSGASGNPHSPQSRSNSYLATKPVFEMGGTKLLTPVGKVTSRRFVADSLMKSYKENAAALVSHSKLRQSSTSGEPGENTDAQPKRGTVRPQSARPAPKDGELENNSSGIIFDCDTCVVGIRILRIDPRSTSPMFQEMRLTKVDLCASFQFEFKVQRSCEFFVSNNRISKLLVGCMQIIISPH
jgi:hypothetical protein